MTAAAKEYADDSKVIGYELAGFLPVWINCFWNFSKSEYDIRIYKNESMERSHRLEAWVNHPRNLRERNALVRSHQHRSELATEYDKEDAYDHRIDEYLYERRLERLGYLEDR